MNRKFKTRTVLAFTLALICVLIFPIIAYATDIAVTADATSVKVGDTITVTVTVSEQNIAVANGVFTYTRRDVGLSSAAYSIWVSTDLLVWIEDTAAVQSQLSVDGDVETVEVTLDSDWLNQDELFIQVRAVE